MTPRIKKACEIVEWAIRNGKKVKEGCAKFGVNGNFVRDVKYDSVGQGGYQQLFDLFDQYKFKKEDKTISQPEVASEGDQKKFEESGNTASFEYKGSKMLTSLEEAIAFFEIDTKLWEVERWLCNSYPTSARVREQDLEWVKNPVTGNSMMLGTAKREDKWTSIVNYQVKVWLKRRVEVEAAFNFEKLFTELLANHRPYKYQPVKYSKNNSNNLLEINIFDLHLGKLCWGEEVKNNYDTGIASERFRYALHQLLERAKGQFDRILFPIGNDFFNSDTHINTTTAGTRVDEDSRWQKTYRTGVKLLIEGIDYARQFAPVDCPVIPGNHDRTKSFFLGETLHAWYRNDANVTVNNSASTRKYYEWGKVLLGFTHGDQEKIEKLRSLMAFEMKEAWARTVYREFHLGHQHRKLAVRHVVKSDMIQEELALLVRYMSSLSGTDAWHDQQGYIGPIRAAEAFLWNKEEGMIASFNSNIRLGDDK